MSNIDNIKNLGLFRSEWNDSFGHRYLLVFTIPGSSVIMQVTFDIIEIKLRTSWDGSTWNRWKSVPLS